MSVNNLNYKAEKRINNCAKLSLYILDYYSQATTASWDLALDWVRFPVVYDLSEMDFGWHLNFQPLNIEIRFQEDREEPKVLIQDLNPHFVQVRAESPFYALQLQNSTLSVTLWCKQL
jgi:hypothetical protein